MLKVNYDNYIPPMSWDIQQMIFESVQNKKISLADSLENYGYNFNDLIYFNSHNKEWNGHSPQRLSDYKLKKNGVQLVSFFTGCGGIDLGFEAAGYEHIAAFEHSILFCNTLRRNKPNWNIFGPPTHSGDVSNVEEIISTLEDIIPKNFDGIFVGGPPCQPFSIAANQRFAKTGKDFKRVGFKHEKNGGLLFNYVELIKHFKPQCFLIENVPGIRDLDGGEQLSLAIKELEKSGYYVDEPRVLNAADYGVPQYRERLFVIGTKRKCSLHYPSPLDINYGAGSVLQLSLNNLQNTETREHKIDSVERYCLLDYGQRDRLGRVDRLDPTLPSKTVIAGGTKGGGRSHLHPEIPRTLSVRECARLQSFPDDYIFTGPMGRQFTQVGNAVPPVLAAQIATSIFNSVFK